jgi:hypothetical protein
VALLWIACAGALGHARRVEAAAEFHRLNLLLSAIPTQVSATDYNDRLDYFNRRYLDPIGVKGLEEIGMAWLFDAEMRYFLKPNIAVTAGVGQLRSSSEREFLPAISEDVQIRAEILSVPVHVGGAYYFRPYNQGDFQARAFLGTGFMSVVYNRARLGLVSSGSVGDTTFKNTGLGDAPGYYFEGGVHMFFAARYSVVLGVLYRSALLRNPRGKLETPTQTIDIPLMADVHPDIPLGGLTEFDTSGIGARLGLAIGF